MSDDALARAIEEGNPPTLALVAMCLSGDTALMGSGLRFKRASPQRMDGGLDADAAQTVRAHALQVVRAFRDSGAPPPPLPPREALHAMMSFALGQPVPPEYVPMLLQDMQLMPDEALEAACRPAVEGRGMPEDFHVIVIGAGPSGIATSIALARMGVRHTVLEKNASVGGTWHENTYPGCRVDVPSHFYSFSFARNPSWSHYYSPRDQLAAYMERVAREHGVHERTRLSTEVVSATYEPARRAWTVVARDAAGREHVLHANAVISAVGHLNRPSMPALPGLDQFAGAAFHSARFRNDVALQGKRIGVVGTGASGMQIVPQLAPLAERLVIFQRSPQWAVPTPDYFREVSPDTRYLLEHVPYYASFFRLRSFYTSADAMHGTLQLDPAWPHPERALNADHDRIRTMLVEHIERELGDRHDLRAACIPDYPPFMKRMLLDNGWFRTLTRDNVALEQRAITRVTEHGIETEGSEHHPLDVLIFATGFQATRFLSPMTITGAHGQTLQEAWSGDPRAHLGITVPGFPNLFMVYGPNTNLAHGGSILFHSECQARYIAGCLRLLADRGCAALDCKPEAFDASNARLDAAQARMVWALPGARNWYRAESGRVASTSPYRLVDYWRMTYAPDPADFNLIR